jgi:catechol 2,3-dioxygenase-like lactoylglutathione lyase family enzyme
MLRDNDAIATLAVRNLKTATEFYEGKLGLTVDSGDGKQVVTYKSGNCAILVYESKFAGTNQATAMTWSVDDVGAIVSDLKNKGVTFEKYDFPGITHEGDVHVFGTRKNAWFKDPDGNILSIVNK